MPLYTVRVSISMLPGLSRGSNMAMMSHHFYFADDDAAVGALPGFATQVTSGSLQWRWLADRDNPSHIVEVFRRDVNDASVSTRLGGYAFDLWSFPPAVVISGHEPPYFGSSLSLAQNERSRRAAVLCITYGSSPGFKQRTYVGPVAPCPLYGTFTVAGFDVFSAYALNPATLDDAPNPNDEYDIWQESVSNAAADHVATFGAGLFPDATHVVVSWKLADWEAATEVKPSVVRADLRSRGLTMPLGPSSVVSH